MRASRPIDSFSPRTPRFRRLRPRPASACLLRALAVSDRLVIPASRVQVSTVRTWLRDRLGPEHPCLDSALIVTGELATNAIVHGSSEDDSVRVSVCKLPRHRVLLSVVDSGSGSGSVPRLRRVDLASTNGRGLQIVGTLAARWRIRPRGRGYEVRVLLSPKGGMLEAMPLPEESDVPSSDLAEAPLAGLGEMDSHARK